MGQYCKYMNIVLLSKNVLKKMRCKIVCRMKLGMSAVVLTPNARETEHVTGFKGQSLFKPSTHVAKVVLLLSTKRLHQTIGSMHISPFPLDDQKK